MVVLVSENGYYERNFAIAIQKTISNKEKKNEGKLSLRTVEITIFL